MKMPQRCQPHHDHDAGEGGACARTATRPLAERLLECRLDKRHPHPSGSLLLLRAECGGRAVHACMHACALRARAGEQHRTSVRRTHLTSSAGALGDGPSAWRGVAWRAAGAGAGPAVSTHGARLRACARVRRSAGYHPPVRAHIATSSREQPTRLRPTRRESSVLWRPDLCSPPSSHPVRYTRHRWRRPSGARCGRRLEVRAGPGRVHCLPTATVPSPSLCRRHLFASSALPVPNLRNC